MADFMGLVDALPPAIKAGWAIWIAWAAAQVLWYRRAYVAATPFVQPAVPPPVARRRPEPRPVRQEAAPVLPEPSPEPAPSLPAIDLSDIRAVVEQSSMDEDDAPQYAGSILGLDARSSTN